MYENLVSKRSIYMPHVQGVDVFQGDHRLEEKMAPGQV